jgi:membrane dipeptidase
MHLEFNVERRLDGNYRDISSTARKLYRRAIIVDANVGPRLDDVIPQPQVNLDIARDAGVTAIKDSIGGFNNDFESVLTDIAFYFRLFEEHNNIFMHIRHAGDFAVAKDTGRLGIIFSFEGVNMLEGKT